MLSGPLRQPRAQGDGEAPRGGGALATSGLAECTTLHPMHCSKQHNIDATISFARPLSVRHDHGYARCAGSGQVTLDGGEMAPQ